MGSWALCPPDSSRFPGVCTPLPFPHTPQLHPFVASAPLLHTHTHTQVAREIKLHVNLAHDSIIAMYAAWKDRNYVYLALEWAPGVRGVTCVCV